MKNSYDSGCRDSGDFGLDSEGIAGASRDSNLSSPWVDPQTITKISGGGGGGGNRRSSTPTPGARKASAGGFRGRDDSFDDDLMDEDSDAMSDVMKQPVRGGGGARQPRSPLGLKPQHAQQGGRPFMVKGGPLASQSFNEEDEYDQDSQQFEEERDEYDDDDQYDGQEQWEGQMPGSRGRFRPYQDVPSPSASSGDGGDYRRMDERGGGTGGKGRGREGETMRDRLEMAVTEAMRRHPCTWDVREVCNWIELIGFMQYRRKFSHNSVDGEVLVAMTDEQLKKDLGVLPLGHRTALIKAVKQLVDAAPQMDSGAPKVMITGSP